jgi:hypothetical protein
MPFFPTKTIVLFLQCRKNVAHSRSFQNEFIFPPSKQCCPCNSIYGTSHSTKTGYWIGDSNFTCLLRDILVSNNPNYTTHEVCPESKDTSFVGWRGNFLCLVWQHCRRPWSFTCEPCLFGSGRTGFVWVRCVWNGSTNPTSRQMRGVFHHTLSQCKRWMSSRNSQTLLLFMVMLWISKMWQSGAVNSPKGGLMFTMNKGAISDFWRPSENWRRYLCKSAWDNKRAVSHHSWNV